MEIYSRTVGMFFSKKRNLIVSTPIFIILAVITVLGLDLRIQSVIHTEIIDPIRADAQDYYLYAYNLKTFGVYSRSYNTLAESDTVPEPDAMRTPAYPLFLALFLDKEPSFKNIKYVTITQAIISTLTILLVYAICRYFLSVPLALTAASLTAISPHLVTMNIYILTETMYCFLLVLMAYLMFRKSSETKSYSHAMFLAAGAVLGLAALTRPTIQYFPLLLVVFFIFHYGLRAGIRKAAIVLLGFLIIYLPWTGRNLSTLGVISDPTLKQSALLNGTYPNLMYRDNPLSYGAPYHFDPRAEEISKDMTSAKDEVIQRFREQPGKQVQWYLIGKPVTLWSWNIIAGMGDVFVYPVMSTPYRYLPHFKATHSLMYILHWPLVFLMAVGALLAWLPSRITGFSGNRLLISRLLSLLLIYHTLLMMVGAPFPRYAVPLRPFMYAVAMLPIMMAMGKFLPKPVQKDSSSRNRRVKSQPVKKAARRRSRR